MENIVHHGVDVGTGHGFPLGRPLDLDNRASRGRHQIQIHARPAVLGVAEVQRELPVDVPDTDGRDLIAKHCKNLDILGSNVYRGPSARDFFQVVNEVSGQDMTWFFDQVYRGYPGLWDGTMTAAARFQYASMRYGDELFEKDQNCDALQQYENAQAISALDKVAQHNYNEAFIGCYPATPTVELPTETPTVGAPTTYP